MVVKALVRAYGTDIGSTADVKTALNPTTGVVMPSWARNLESIKTWASHDVHDSDLSAVAKITLESDDVPLDPCITITNPIGGYDATSGQPYQSKMESFDINCPLKGGEKIMCYGTMLQSFTGPTCAGVTFTVTDMPPTKRQRYYQVGTITETGTAAATVTGTRYNIHGSDAIVEVFGMVMTEVHDAENAIFGSFRLTSNDFVRACPLDYGFEPISGCIGTLQGPHIMGIIRFPVDVPTHQNCYLQDYCTFDLAPTVHGFWLSGVSFTKAGR